MSTGTPHINSSTSVRGKLEGMNTDTDSGDFLRIVYLDEKGTPTSPIHK